MIKKRLQQTAKYASSCLRVWRTAVMGGYRHRLCFRLRVQIVIPPTSCVALPGVLDGGGRDGRFWSKISVEKNRLPRRTILRTIAFLQLLRLAVKINIFYYREELDVRLEQHHKLSHIQYVHIYLAEDTSKSTYEPADQPPTPPSGFVRSRRREGGSARLLRCPARALGLLA